MKKMLTFDISIGIVIVIDNNKLINKYDVKGSVDNKDVSTEVSIGDTKHIKANGVKSVGFFNFIL